MILISQSSWWSHPRAIIYPLRPLALYVRQPGWHNAIVSLLRSRGSMAQASMQHVSVSSLASARWPNPSLHRKCYSGLRPLPHSGELKRWAQWLVCVRRQVRSSAPSASPSAPFRLRLEAKRAARAGVLRVSLCQAAPLSLRGTPPVPPRGRTCHGVLASRPTAFGAPPSL